MEPANNHETPRCLDSVRVVLGISGGIAAYKTPELVRLLRKAGAHVRVCMTESAQQFVTPLVLQTLSGHRVATQLFDPTEESEIGHIALADEADVLLIAPATADVLAKLSLGLAGDILTTVALACRAPLVLCPAMNVHMWDKPQVQEHIARLVARGAHVLGPGEGEMACGHVGKGRMVEPDEIVRSVAQTLRRNPPEKKTLIGRHVVVTAGPTIEPIDPVRFLGNRSSGKMGFALAATAAELGARVTLVTGPVALATPTGVQRIDVETAQDMQTALLSLFGKEPAPDCIAMAAAVADYRPAERSSQKLKKHTLGEHPALALSKNPDILRSLSQARRGKIRFLLGFAAETHDIEAFAKRKLLEKGCDAIVANDVTEAGSGFGSDTNRVVVFFKPESGEPDAVRLPVLPKTEVARELWKLLAPHFSLPSGASHS